MLLRRLLAVVVLAATMIGVAPAPPASAGITHISRSKLVRMPSNRIVTPNVETVVHSTDVTLQAGERRMVRNQIEVLISSREGAEIRNILECIHLETGSAHAPAYASGTNHRGSGHGAVRIRGNLLITATHAGTYRCQTRTYASDGPRTDFHITVVAGDALPYGTWISISETHEPDAYWWQNQACSPDGTGNCVYLGSPGDRTVTNVFEGGVTPERWTAADGAVQAHVSAALQVTSCTQGGSCIPEKRGDTDISTVRTQLHFVQFKPNGSACNVTSTPESTHSIPNSVHHLPLYFELYIDILTTCLGSRQFRAELMVRWVSGNPIKVDSGTYTEYRSATNAAVISTGIATTRTVPNVVGSGQTEAESAIRGAGLSVGTISRIVNAAPPGTVIDQNSPGGTIQPEGLPVNLTVSIGWPVTVNPVSSISSPVGSPGNNGFWGQFTTSSGIGPFTWTATGLPPGITLDSSSGALRGVPNTPGPYDVVYTATDRWGGSDTKSFRWYVTVAMPGLIGLTAEQADEALAQANAGLIGQSSERTVDRMSQHERVVQQHPAAGTQVAGQFVQYVIGFYDIR